MMSVACTQDSAAATCLDNLGGDILSVPKDIGAKIYRELFLAGGSALSSFHRTCRAIYFVWRKAFREQYLEYIEKSVRLCLTPVDKWAVIGRVFGSEALPQSIIDSFGTFKFDPRLEDPESKQLIDRLPPRLLCTHLSIVGRKAEWYSSESYSKLPSLIALVCAKLSKGVFGDAQKRLQDVTSICQPFLESFTACSADMTDALLDGVATRCPRLATLVLTDCHKVVFSGKPVWESLTYLKSTSCYGVGSDAGLEHVARRCPKLTTLTVWGACDHDVQQGMSSAGIKALANGCPNLTTLELYGCHGIDVESLFALAEKCPSLAHIRIQGRKLPTLYDSIKLLMKFPGISQFTRRQWDMPDNMYAMIDDHLNKRDVQYIVDLAWAWATIGLYADLVVDMLIDRALTEITDLSDEERMKMQWVCKKFGRENDAQRFLSRLSAKTEPEEESQKAKNRAVDVLTKFIDRVPE